ncbi:BA14K-like protein [Bradyrhizobium lablabi]|uniref:Lectin-like protein BA14k n=1 Tax=Bradyrhizobium lablabi TaxID=722472 RepID=A0A1M7DNI8_9BRAD|nr:BA14K family protein [Bradyrhizobium lablabi]SHL80943.1 BA14K-like protein [Bradyrhizobium lablabi]
MTRIKFLSVVAIVSAITVAPVFAQAAIQEPGAFAFYHPDADVLNGGRPTPAAAADAMASVRSGNRDAFASMDGSGNSSSCARRYRSFDPASGTYLGHDGYRHPCQ